MPVMDWMKEEAQEAPSAAGRLLGRDDPGLQAGAKRISAGPRFGNHPVDLKGNNDLLTLTKPEIIRDIGRQYLEAGADFIETNTFNSNFTSQEDYGLGHLVGELNEAGARLARELVRSSTPPPSARAWWRACWARPTAPPPSRPTSTIRPSATSPSTSCAKPIATATRGLIKGGADVLMIETVFDTLNCKAAIFAIEEVFAETGRAPAGLDFRHHHRSVRPHPDRPDAGSLLAFGAPCQAFRHRAQLRAWAPRNCAPISPNCRRPATRW